MTTPITENKNIILIPEKEQPKPETDSEKIARLEKAVTELAAHITSIGNSDTQNLVANTTQPPSKPAAPADLSQLMPLLQMFAGGNKSDGAQDWTQMFASRYLDIVDRAVMKMFPTPKHEHQHIGGH